MILEHAVLNVRSGQARQFEEAMRKARYVIEEVPGFQRMEVRACVETKERYLLLVWWRSARVPHSGLPRHAALREMARVAAQFL